MSKYIVSEIGKVLNYVRLIIVVKILVFEFSSQFSPDKKNNIVVHVFEKCVLFGSLSFSYIVETFC